MTRFSLSISDAVSFVMKCLDMSIGGEIFVPKIKSYKLIDLANSINSKKKKKAIGLRPGEKIHEELITKADSSTTFDMGNYYVILPPQYEENLYRNKYKKFKENRKVKSDFSYNSFNNNDFLTIKQLKNQTKIYKKNNE